MKSYRKRRCDPWKTGIQQKRGYCYTIYGNSPHLPVRRWDKAPPPPFLSTSTSTYACFWVPISLGGMLNQEIFCAYKPWPSPRQDGRTHTSSNSHLPLCLLAGTKHSLTQSTSVKQTGEGTHLLCAMHTIKHPIFHILHIPKQHAIKAMMAGCSPEWWIIFHWKQRRAGAGGRYNLVNSSDILTIACCQSNGLTYTTTSNYY